jgi:RTX calcium-binding nonapeptide repeat (4 copies)
VSRRLLWVTVVGAVLVLVFGGVALAAFIQCDGGRCEGTKRDDLITGSTQRDRIFALGGYDSVYGYQGEDELHGAGGGDYMSGGPGPDTSYGGDEGDVLFEDTEESGNDVMNGGDGGDYLAGLSGDDVLRGERGSESSGSFDVRMVGGEGNDELYGGKGGDAMAGEQGRDRHYGGRDADLIDAAHPEAFDGRDVRDFVDCGRGNDQAIVLPNDRVLANCEDVERVRVLSGVSAQEAKASAEEKRQQALERFLAEREADKR